MLVDRWVKAGKVNEVKSCSTSWSRRSEWTLLLLMFELGRDVVKGWLSVEETTERHTRRSIQCDHARGYEDLWNRYFKPDCMYSESTFRRRFRMRRALFFRIRTDIEQAEPYFIQRWNAAGRLGFQSLQKMITALHMLAYGAPADNMDKCFQIAETTAVDSSKIFYKIIVRLYRDQYLREPTDNDLARLFAEGEAYGFPDMLGSLDCMH